MRNENQNLIKGLNNMINGLNTMIKNQVEATKERSNLDKIIQDFHNKESYAKELTQMRHENKNLVDGLDIMIKRHFWRQVEVVKERNNLDKIIQDFRNKEMKELIWYREKAQLELKAPVHAQDSLK